MDKWLALRFSVVYLGMPVDAMPFYVLLGSGRKSRWNYADWSQAILGMR